MSQQPPRRSLAPPDPADFAAPDAEFRRLALGVLNGHVWADDEVFEEDEADAELRRAALDILDGNVWGDDDSEESDDDDSSWEEEPAERDMSVLVGRQIDIRVDEDCETVADNGDGVPIVYADNCVSLMGRLYHMAGDGPVTHALFFRWWYACAGYGSRLNAACRWIRLNYDSIYANVVQDIRTSFLRELQPSWYGVALPRQTDFYDYSGCYGEIQELHKLFCLTDDYIAHRRTVDFRLLGIPAGQQQRSPVKRSREE